MRGITAGVISVFVLGLFISPGVGAESSEQIEAKITMMDGDAKPATTPGPGSVDQGKVAFDFNHRSIFIALEEPTAVSSIVLKSDSGIFADASNVNLTADRLEVYFSNDNVEFEKVSFGYHTPDNSTIVLDGLQGVAKYLKIHTTCGWTTPYRFVNQLGKMVSITAGIMATTQAITADSSAEQSQVSARKKTFENVKILNNLVWELLNVDKHQQGTFSKEYRFSAPETCWIFIQSTATSGSGGEVRVFVEGLNSEAPLLTHGPGKPDVQEAMRQVSAGQHTLRIEGKGDAELSHLTVRRIPTLRYGMFDPYPRMVNEFGPYDRKFLAEDVLRNVNTILDAHWDNNDFGFLKEWKAQGRKFFMHDAVKYFEKGAPDAVEQCVRY